MNDPSPWQPFATAPEDGTEIIVWREDSGVFTAKFYSADSVFDDVDLAENCWFAGGEDLTFHLPTLWMPLPPEPTEDES